MESFELLFGSQGWGGLLLKGAAVTLLLALTTLPLGLGGGLLLARLKQSPRHLVRVLCNAYTTFFRGTPDLLILFIVYFGLQALIDNSIKILALDSHLELSAFAAGVIGLATVVAAYSSEVWIAALAAVPRGQIEAALVLGLSKRQSFLLVQLPQAARIALPGLGNIWNSLLKDTSIISTIAVMDLLRTASEASRSTTRPILFYGMAAAVYFGFSIGSEIAQTRLARYLNKKTV